MNAPDPSQLPTVAPVPEILADLEWRGLLAQSTDREALARDLAAGPVTLYCGFDPTAPSYHVGNLMGFMLLAWLQRFGHKPIALMGGGTALIGT